MRDVDEGRRLEGDGRRRQHEGACAKRRQGRRQLFDGARGQPAEVFHRRGAPRLAAVRVGRPQRLEHTLQDLLGPRVGRAHRVVQRFVGIVREGAFEAAARVVGVEPDAAVLFELPAAHQRVLEQRQLVLIVAKLDEQTLHQRVVDVAASHPRGALDCLPQLLAGQPGDEVLALVDCFGQPSVHRGPPQELRAHGDDEVHVGTLGRHVGTLPARGQQQPHERGLLVGVDVGVVRERQPEQLLELIHEHEHVLAGAQVPAGELEHVR